MIDAGAFRELIDTYKKHGWVLRRVLLSDALSAASETDKRSLFGDVPILGSDLDAAWFSRPPKPGGVAWEIRYLGDVPYALLENVDEESPEFQSRLTEVEGRLRASLGAKRTA